MEKFDKAIKQLIGFWQIVLVLVPAILNAGALVFGYKKGMEGSRGFVVLGIGLAGSIFSMIAGWAVWLLMVRIKEGCRLRQDKMDAELRLEKSKAFDYKFCAPIDSASFQYLVSRFDRNAGDGKSAFSVFDMKDGEVEVIPRNDVRYVACDELLQGCNEWNGDFKSMPVRDAEKFGKCVVQLSFVPVDRLGNVPLILRMPHSHSREAALKKDRKPHFTFVSFSPVPMRYGMTFAPSECYHREVPVSQVGERAPEELGLAIKCELLEDQRRYYLFYVYKVFYPEVVFVKDDGSLDKKTIDSIFAVNGSGTKSIVQYFTKDHDVIVAAASVSDFRNGIGSGRDLDRVQNINLRTLLSCDDYEITTRVHDVLTGRDECWTDHHNMNESSFGPVERRVLEGLLFGC